MSLWRRPGTRTFKLVHRSQRDPLINDPDASDRVLAEVVSASQQRKQSKDTQPGSAQQRLDQFAANEQEYGDAAAYGIYFDDTEYDYMQHLRTVGSATDAYLVEAQPHQRKSGSKDMQQVQLREANAQDAKFEMPEDVLPSHPYDESSYVDVTTGKSAATGLRPDLDPRIREVLEALDDEAYAVEAHDEDALDDEDNFFRDVVEGGEVDVEDWYDEDEHDGRVATTDDNFVDDASEPIEARIARFKASAVSRAQYIDSDDENFKSEQGDTLADMKSSAARRVHRPAALNSVAGSQFSMSSSAMFRNEGLRTLDDRFDQIEKLYDEESDDSWGDEELCDGEDADGERIPRLVSTNRQDLNEIFDEFLSRYEVLGGKMKPILDAAPGTQGSMGKLEALRQELPKLDIDNDDPEAVEKRREKDQILAAVRRQQKEDRRRTDRIDIEHVKPKERWDCETVLSTYSNVSNHPRMLRMRDLGPRPAQIKIDRSGFPVVDTEVQKLDRQKQTEEEFDDDESEGELVPVKEPVKRPKGESPEERKARKEAVKQERASRRAQKKSTKEEFSTEIKRQKRIAGKAVAGGAAADVKGEGVRRLA
ncbi:Protein ltv1 [Microbotryomycetes sp. JL201]|nr:Protein ltv1 [Microbotryomycetes sp. JL201]